MFLKIMNILKQNIDTLSLICLNIICSPFKALLDKYPLFRKKLCCLTKEISLQSSHNI